MEKYVGFFHFGVKSKPRRWFAMTNPHRSFLTCKTFLLLSRSVDVLDKLKALRAGEDSLSLTEYLFVIKPTFGMHFVEKL